MKILIVDDEPLARIGMRAIIQWDKHGYELAGEASNGLEALRIAETVKPDIILVDIIMPEMNGLEFINRVRKILPKCKIVILSCMNESKYFREAIHLDVSEYILKDTLNPDEVLEVVNQLADEIRRERVYDNEDGNPARVYINNNLILTGFLDMVLKGQIKDSQLIERKLNCCNISLKTNNYIVLAMSYESSEKMQMDQANDDDHNSDDVDLNMDYSILNICQEIVKDVSGGYIFKNYEDILTAIISCPEEHDTEMFLNLLFRRISETVNQCLDLNVTIGASKVFHWLCSIQDGYREAVAALDLKFTKGGGRLFVYNNAAVEKSAVSAIDKELAEIMKAESILEYDLVKRKLGVIVKQLETLPVFSSDKVRGIFTDVLYHAIGILRREGISINEAAGDGFDIFKFVSEPGSAGELHYKTVKLLDAMKDYYLKMYPKNMRIVNTIRNFIDDHICEKLSLSVLAKKVYLSPSYVCRLYKKETGENLQDYILRKKISKSLEILKAGADINKAAEQLGFNSTSYFIKVFRVHMGTTPSRFIKDCSTR